ncbi:MAG: precorrin-3B synthase [Pseudomonadota bacterium]
MTGPRTNAAVHTDAADTPEIKGWCPGGHRPMMSGDGLVVRVRPWLGAVSPEQACALADLAARHGNGRIEITSRANLQLRGVTEASLPALLDALTHLDLLDADAETEARRNIVLSPFSECSRWDVPAMAAGLSAGLRSAAFAGLPSKFGFAIDPGPERHLGGVSGDIRIEASRTALLVRADGAAHGLPVASETAAVATALSMAAWFLASGGVGPDGRGRLRSHLSANALPDALQGHTAPNRRARAARPGPMAGGTLVAAAFGQLTPDALRALSRVAAGDLRMTPFRMIYLPATRLDASPHPDLIIAPDDPLLRVVACTGAPGCPQGRAPVRSLARQLAPSVAPTETLHVSGCRKGCAHPRRATMTLVASESGFGLVRNGTPWDQPDRTGLSAAETRTLLET